MDSIINELDQGGVPAELADVVELEMAAARSSDTPKVEAKASRVSR